MDKRATTRDLSTADTAGQELVPPLYLQDTFVEARVASAIAANLVTNLPLPPTGRSVTVPFQNGAASVGITSENSAASENDATFDGSTATVYMAQGIQDLSAQLVERSEPGADMVMMRHLARLLASHIDTKIINGSGSSEPRGVLNATGENAVTWTDYSPTFAEAYPKIADAIQQVEAGWLKSPTGIVVHPRRANKWLSELDSSNRPLAAPAPLGAQNVLATNPNTGERVAEGFSGYSILGVPMYKDANVPTTLGGSTIQDAVLICDWEALMLWLGPVIFEVSKDVGFKNSTFTVKARQYYAFSCNHAPEAIAHITGAGLDTPTF
jgi:HK97 family phage major capsid protein